MKTDHKEIRMLLNRFFAGETTVAEERRLARLFSSDGLPDDLAQYRPMFSWYDSMSAPTVKTGRRTWRLWRYVAAAAAVAVVATVSVDAALRFHQRSVMEEMYAGSFIVKNGEKVTDIDVVLSEMEKAEARINEIERRHELENRQALAQVEKIENKIFNTYNYE